MNITVLKSKIHNAVVTECNLEYVGSITIAEDLMKAVGLVPHEKVMVVNNNNGERIETYVIKGKAETGTICLNGAAAHKFKKGDVVIIMAFGQIRSNDSFEPSVIFPYCDNVSYKDNDDICEELLVSALVEKGAITNIDVEKISLQMGRDEKEIEEMAEKIIGNNLKK